jgi:MULE transposase domain
MFRAVLLYDQSIKSFYLVFDTFLKYHNNKKPKIIFTNQDEIMEITIANMMLDVSHSLCTWHISENATKHLISHNDDEMDCVAEFRTYICVYLYMKMKENLKMLLVLSKERWEGLGCLLYTKKEKK